MRVELDTRENYNPGWKYNYWEQKGVPLRIELGPKDLEKEQVVFARRDDASPSGKMTVKWSEVAARAPEMLETIQVALLEKARKERDAHPLREHVGGVHEHAGRQHGAGPVVRAH